jgi:hypothetical protein
MAGVDMKPWMIKLFRDGTNSQQVDESAQVTDD